MTAHDAVVYAFAYIGLWATCFAVGWFSVDVVTWMKGRRS